MKTSVAVACLAWLPFVSEARTLENADDFVANYGEVSLEGRRVVEAAFEAIERYRSSDGVALSARDGFVPLSSSFRNRGTPWFDPGRLLGGFELASPTGLNFDDQGRLVSLFWMAPKYPDLRKTFDLEKLAELSLERQALLLRNMKAYLRFAPPGEFQPFGAGAAWRSYENVVVDNVGARAVGELWPALVRFRQSLPVAVFLQTLWSSWMSPDVTMAGLEGGEDLAYPHFNQLFTPGYYVMQMWIPLHNAQGAFAPSHADLSPEAPEESGTVADPAGPQTDLPPTEPEVSVEAVALVDRALAGDLAATHVPAGNALCANYYAERISENDIVRSGLLHALVRERDVGDSFRTEVRRALEARCSAM